MRELHLDLSREATRRSILADLLRRFPDECEGVSAAVGVAGIPDRHHRDLRDIERTIAALRVPSAVKQDMGSVYLILAEAEARVHGAPVAQTHFHEVGDAEALRSVLGICLAIDRLRPCLVTSTPVQVGSGIVHCAHGDLPIPAPATEAVVSRGIPVCATRLAGELCTPTSAAVILHFVDRFVSE